MKIEDIISKVVSANKDDVVFLEISDKLSTAEARDFMVNNMGSLQAALNGHSVIMIHSARVIKTDGKSPILLEVDDSLSDDDIEKMVRELSIISRLEFKVIRLRKGVRIRKDGRD